MLGICLVVGCAQKPLWNDEISLGLCSLYTCDSNGVMTAKSTSQGHICVQNKIQQAENV